MNLLKNLKILQKLILLVSIAAFFISIVWFVGFHFLTKAANDIATIYKDRLIPVNQLDVSLADNIQIKSNLLDMVSSNTQSKRIQYNKKFPILQNEMDKLLGDYSLTYLMPYEEENLSKLKQEREKFAPVLEQIRSLAMAGKLKEAANILSDNESNIDKISALLRDLAEYNVKYAGKINSQNNKDTTFAIRLIIVINIIALITTVTIGLLIANMISSPINLIVDKMKNYTPGQKVEKIPVLYNDETGVLTDIFNKFTELIYENEIFIKQQQQSLLELSTPVIKLGKGILFLPIVGILDSTRAMQLMEGLLEKIAQTSSHIAIIDVTGVTSLDTFAIQNLLKTIAAAKLMGTHCIISGIRPSIAQTITHLGINLPDVITKSTLAEAFSLAVTEAGSKTGNTTE